jgi:glutathione S-transferase
MEFHFGKNSGNSARVAFALYEARVPFAPHVMHVPRGESRTPEYLALNPMGKVPALIDGATSLWESNAINWYIAERSPEAKLLPTTAARRASVLRWQFFQAGHVTPAAMAVYRTTSARAQKYWGMKPDADAAENGRKELARFLPVLETALDRRDWLEEEFSLADIAYAPHLWFLAEAGFDFPGTPRVRAWLERMLLRPAWQQVQALVFEDPPK